jgi:hypothetical protein
MGSRRVHTRSLGNVHDYSVDLGVSGLHGRKIPSATRRSRSEHLSERSSKSVRCCQFMTMRHYPYRAKSVHHDRLGLHKTMERCSGKGDTIYNGYFKFELYFIV